MELFSYKVGLAHCRSYDRGLLKEKVDLLFRQLNYSVSFGSKVLLKPNLVSSRGHKGLAVTNPQLVAAIAELFVDHGAVVAIGDSPAFGSAVGVMRSCGFFGVMRALPVRFINFERKKHVRTLSGFSLTVADEIFDHDEFINIAKLKAHNQMRLTMAVKNLFGVVLGWRKAMAHMKHGDDGSFVELIVDLLDLAPGGLSIIDGVIGMHKHGPMGGESINTEFIGASKNPVALDSAVINIIGAKHAEYPIWCECFRRGIVGSDPLQLDFKGARPDQLSVNDFCLPEVLDNIRFNPGQMVLSTMKRFFVR